MSFTARERYNPPPRKKSCAACIKAKRRCDFAVPACLRCSQRQIQCEYPSRTPPAKAKVKASNRVAFEPAPLQDMAVPDGALDGDGTEGAKPMACQLGPTGSVDEESSQHDMHAFLSDLATLDYGAESHDYDVVQQPSMLTAPATKGLHDRLTEIVARRLQFSLDQIQKAPRTMVMEMQTPWSHPLLYADSMPRSMQGTRAILCLVIRSNAANTMKNIRRSFFLCSLLGKEPSKYTCHPSLHRVSSAGFVVRAFTNDANGQPRSHPSSAPLPHCPPL